MKKAIYALLLAASTSIAYLTPGGGSGSGGAPSGPAGGDLTGTYPNPTLAVDRVDIAGDTMTGNFGTQQVRLPFGTSPGSILYGDDTDTGPYQVSDGEYFIASNGFPRVRVSQNLTEFLGPVTVNSNLDIAGSLTFGSITLPANSVDLSSSVVYNTLPVAKGGTGTTSFGPTGSIPFYDGTALDNDWANLNYDTGFGRLTVPQVFQNVTLNSVTSGVTFESLRMQPTLSGTFNYFTGIGMGATLNGVTVSNAVQTFDFSNVFNGDNHSPNGVLDFNIHHDFRNNEGYIGGFKSLAFSNNFNDHDYVTLIDSNNVVGVTSNIANYKVFDMHDQVLAGATVNNYVALNHTINNSGGIGSYTGINDQPNFIVSPSSYIGINIAAQGGVTVSDPIGLNLSTDNLYSSTAFNRPKAIQHNGKGVFAFTSNTTLPNSHPSVVDSINNMISVVRTEPGSPLSGTGSLGWNFGGFIDAQANVSLDPIGAGINAAGWVSLVGISSGVTVAQAGGTISVPVNSTGASSGATGGHLSAFKHYQAFPFFTGGGSNTLGDNWGFSVPSGFCGGITGECYGIHLGDSGAKSYLAGPVTLGLASDTVPYLDGATTLVSSSVSGTELGYLNGVTASLQTQINAIMSTNSSQDAAIAALQGITAGVLADIAAIQVATATHSAEIAALQGVTSNTWVRLAGDTMTGSLYGTATTMTGKILAADTLSSVTHDINPLRSNGGISALGGLWSGNVNGSGGGGAVRLRRDTPSPAGVPLEGWRIALGGGAGDTNLAIRDVQNAATIINVTTARQVQFPTGGTRLSFEQDGGNTSLETVALSGASTLISNTTITANSYPFMLSQGADVSPYLIGLSAGVGYSVGASGAGTVKAFILEGQ